MKHLLGILKAAQSMSCKGSFGVLTSPDFKQMEVMHGYYIQEWLSDVDPGTRAAFVFFFQRFRYIPEHDSQYEFKFMKRCRVIGLGIAHLESCFAISLPSRPRWNTHELEIEKHEADDQGEMLPPVICRIRHACASAHLEHHALKWRQSDKHRPVIGWGTIMLLSDDDAQKVLNCSVQVEGDTQRYGYDGEAFYEFPSDNVGTYHGYPITLEDLREAGKHEAVLKLLLEAGRLTQVEYEDFIK